MPKGRTTHISIHGYTEGEQDNPSLELLLEMSQIHDTVKGAQQGQPVVYHRGMSHGTLQCEAALKLRIKLAKKLKSNRKLKPRAVSSRP